MNRARLSRGLASALVATFLGASVATPGACAARTATGSASRTPTFPIPASARVHGASPATTSTPATTAGGTTGGAAGTRTTPPVGTGAGATGAATTAPGSVAAPGVSTAPAGTPATGTPAGTPSTARPPATTVPAVPVRPGASTPPATARHARAGSRRLSTGAIVAAVLAALLILVCLVWGAARWLAYEPRWVVSLRHSLAEAGWRLSASWDEFSDWARIGR